MLTGEASIAMLFDSYAEAPPTATDPDGNFPVAAALRA